MPKLKLFTLPQFNALLPELRAQLIGALKKEQAEGALADEGGTDLWELPPVDSKTVAKLSPLVKELTGRRLDPKWIRKGGYQSVDSAVDDLLVQLRKHCVSEPTSHAADESLSHTLTS